jgi:Plavaka transposase
MIIAYLPIADFSTDESNAGDLKMRLFHQCMEILLCPLIGAGTRGLKMTDSKGAVRMCYPFVAGYLADHPEQCLVNCCLQNVCPTTLATFRQMGDPTPAAPRTREWILARINEACGEKDPAAIGPYHKVASSLGINGVNKPFWRNLPRYEPNLVIAPDLLHGPGIFWRNHLFLWIQRLVGTKILDRRLMALQPVAGYKSFKNGISHLSQWTGREDRELQRVTVALVAGTARMKPEILRNIRAFHDFIYLAQYRSHSTTTLRYLADALAIFHATKHVWIDEEVRYGANAGAQMDHFNIPKLAMFHAFVTHVPEMGASPQFSTDITEYNHQFMAKTAYKATNRKDFAVQMCRFLDRSDRLARQAELIEWCQQQTRESKIELELAQYQDDPLLQESIREELKQRALAVGESPYRSRMKKSRLWLRESPHEKDISLASISERYKLPNLLAATNEFLSEYEGLPPKAAGSERVDSTSTVDIWTNLRIRLPDVLDDEVFSVHTVDARPPLVNNKVKEPYGNCHCVLVHDTGDAEAVEIKGELATIVLSVWLTAIPRIPCRASAPTIPPISRCLATCTSSSTCLRGVFLEAYGRTRGRHIHVSGFAPCHRQEG